MMELKERQVTELLDAQHPHRTYRSSQNKLFADACEVLFRLPQILLSQVQELAQNTSVIILLPSLTTLCPRPPLNRSK